MTSAGHTWLLLSYILTSHPSLPIPLSPPPPHVVCNTIGSHWLPGGTTTTKMNLFMVPQYKNTSPYSRNSVLRRIRVWTLSPSGRILKSFQWSGELRAPLPWPYSAALPQTCRWYRCAVKRETNSRSFAQKSAVTLASAYTPERSPVTKEQLTSAKTPAKQWKGNKGMCWGFVLCQGKMQH